MMKRNISQTNTREVYWDLAKALLMFLVIWGHCIQFIQYSAGIGDLSFWESPIFKGIYLFHMPLFMFISGYFSAASISKHGKASIVRYATRLGIPCISLGLLRIGEKWCCHIPILHPFNDFIALWFLVVLLGCICIYYPFRAYRNLLFRSLLMILPLSFAVLFRPYCPIMQLILDQFTFHWPIFLIGVILYERGFNASDIKKGYTALLTLAIPLAFVVPISIFVYCNPLILSPISLAYDVARTLIAMILGLGFLGLVQYMIGIVKYSHILYLGRATLAIYVLQTLLFSYICAFLPQGINTLSDFQTFGLSLLILLILYVLYRFLQHIPLLPFLLFGERK